MLNVMVEIARDLVTISCEGGLVAGEEDRLLCAATRHPGQDVNLDMSGVTRIDAAGIRALISLQAAGIYLRLMNLPDAVRQVLRVTSVDSIFEISEDEQVACAVH